MIWLVGWGCVATGFLFGAVWGKLMTERELSEYYEQQMRDKYVQGNHEGYEEGYSDAYKDMA